MSLLSPSLFDDKLFYSCFYFKMCLCVIFYFYCILMKQIETKLSIISLNLSEFKLIFSCVEKRKYVNDGKTLEIMVRECVLNLTS